jgi:hypothetical protein
MEHRASEENSCPLKKNRKRLLTRAHISSVHGLGKPIHVAETAMNAPTPSAAPEKALPVHLDVEAEISKLAEESIPKRPPQIETEVERIRSSITRLTSSSIDGLEGLTSELQELQRFLNSEVQRVQGEIESALAGIKIIIDTIAPWKSSPGSLVPPTGARTVRAGPASKY